MPYPLRTVPLLLTGMAFAALLFLAIGSLVLPLGPDQALFAWVGTVILDGGVPYRDAWDIKGPVTHYIYALAQGLFGRSELSIRILDLLIVLAGCWALRRVVLQLNGQDRFGANGAVILFGLFYYAGGYADIAQPEGWGGLLILCVIALLLSWPRRRLLVMSLVGALIALAALMKPTFLIYTLLPLVFVVGPGARGERWLGSLLCCALGFALVMISATLFLAATGALDDFLDMLRYLYTTYRHYSTPFGSLLTLPQTLFHFGLLVPYLLVVPGLRHIRTTTSIRSTVLVALWFVLANITVIVQGRYWQDHWLPAGIASAAIAGVALTYINQRLLVTSQRLGAQALALTIILLAFAPLVVRAVSRNSQWPGYVAGTLDRHAYIAHVTKPFNEASEPFNYMQLRQVADYIARHSEPSDRLAVWGWDVSVFIMSERRSATRFAVFQPLVETGAVQEKYRQLFLRDLARLTPGYLVVDTRGAWLLEEGAGLTLLDEFPEFRHLLHTQYELSTTLGAYQIWTRADGAAGTYPSAHAPDPAR